MNWTAATDAASIARAHARAPHYQCSMHFLYLIYITKGHPMNYFAFKFVALCIFIERGHFYGMQKKKSVTAPYSTYYTYLHSCTQNLFEICILLAEFDCCELSKLSLSLCHQLRIVLFFLNHHPSFWATQSLIHFFNYLIWFKISTLNNGTFFFFLSEKTIACDYFQ